MDQTQNQSSGNDDVSERGADLAYARRVDVTIAAVCERQLVTENDLATVHGFTDERWDELTKQYLPAAGRELVFFANALEVTPGFLMHGYLGAVTPLVPSSGDRDLAAAAG